MTPQQQNKSWFASVLLDLMRQRKVSAEQLADKADLDRETLVQILEGRINPRLITAERLLAYFGLELEVMQKK